METNYYKNKVFLKLVKEKLDKFIKSVDVKFFDRRIKSKEKFIDLIIQTLSTSKAKKPEKELIELFALEGNFIVSNFNCCDLYMEIREIENLFLALCSVATPCKFTLDGFNVNGYTLSETFGGYDVPYFDETVTKRIMRKVKRYANVAFDKRTKTYVVTLKESGKVCYYGPIEIFVNNGEIVNVYSVGGGTWTWRKRENK